MLVWARANRDTFFKSMLPRVITEEKQKRRLAELDAELDREVWFESKEAFEKLIEHHGYSQGRCGNLAPIVFDRALADSWGISSCWFHAFLISHFGGYDAYKEKCERGEIAADLERLHEKYGRGYLEYLRRKYSDDDDDWDDN